MIIHILKYGRPLCNFHPGTPNLWPDNHKWVSLEEKEKANCEICKTNAVDFLNDE